VIAASLAAPGWQALPPIRRTAAKRLSEAARTVPQFFLDATAAARPLERARRSLVGVTLTHLLLLAAARALEEHPDVNVNFEERDGVPGLVRLSGTSIGLAVATDEGLVVPTVRHVTTRALSALVEEVDALVERARSGSLRPGDIGGAALTVTNLGPFGISRFHAVVNPPESCILAVGALAGTPPALPLSLTADHRAIDGVQAARFLMDVVALVEDPHRLLEAA